MQQFLKSTKFYLCITIFKSFMFKLPKDISKILSTLVSVLTTTVLVCAQKKVN